MSSVPTFVDVMWLAPLFPKRHNDVILEKIVWRRPLSGINLTGNSNFYATTVVSVDRTSYKMIAISLGCAFYLKTFEVPL